MPAATDTTYHPRTPRTTRAPSTVPGGRKSLQVKVDPAIPPRIAEIADALGTTVAEVNRLVVDLGMTVIDLAIEADRCSLEDFDTMIAKRSLLTVRKRTARRSA